MPARPGSGHTATMSGPTPKAESNRLVNVGDWGSVDLQRWFAVNGRDLAHTTLITTLGVMEKKGFVKKRKGSGRGYEFAPRVSREDVSQGMVGDLLDRVFEGSASAMVLSLLENEQVDANEHEELKKAIRRYRKEENNA